MIEKLYAFVISLHTNIVTQKEYEDFLDTIFLNDPTNELLLDLEVASKDFNETLALVNEALYKKEGRLDFAVFGKVLFENLGAFYKKDVLEIADFGRRAYSIWHLLPNEINQTEPFWTLCYAGDYLSFGDESQTRELYERAFSYSWTT